MAGALRATTTVSTKGQIVLPKAIREHAGLKPGDKLTIEAGEGQVTLRAPLMVKPTTVDEVAGMFRHLGCAVDVDDMRVLDGDAYQA